jgi:hypothetical protein
MTPPPPPLFQSISDIATSSVIDINTVSAFQSLNKSVAKIVFAVMNALNPPHFDRDVRPNQLLDEAHRPELLAYVSVFRTVISSYFLH